MAREFSKHFYNSKEWKAVRDSVLKRDFLLCRVCGKPAEEVHHIVHLSPKNIDDVTVSLNPSNLISLCRDCHFDVHRRDKENGLKEYNKTKSNKDDCGEDFYFDENGMLVPLSNQ